MMRESLKVNITKIYRPWGHFLTLEEGLNWKVKRIEVNPKDKLSLQLQNIDQSIG